jgi:hypothetical protein
MKASCLTPAGRQEAAPMYSKQRPRYTKVLLIARVAHICTVAKAINTNSQLELLYLTLYSLLCCTQLCSLEHNCAPSPLAPTAKGVGELQCTCGSSPLYLRNNKRGHTKATTVIARQRALTVKHWTRTSLVIALYPKEQQQQQQQQQQLLLCVLLYTIRKLNTASRKLTVTQASSLQQCMLCSARLSKEHCCKATTTATATESHCCFYRVCVSLL